MSLASSIDTDRRPHIVFAGGGTGGHLFPGLAVARCLAHAVVPPRITFAGSGQQFERRHVEGAGFEYLVLPCRRPSRQPWGAARFVVDHLRGQRAARRFIRRRQVTLVVGLGGYVSVPMARAAVALGVPLVLLEQNAVPGQATRWLARGARLICSAFQDVRRWLPAHVELRITGNPIADEFAALSSLRRARGHVERPRLVILGGSQGAASLNDAMPRALASLPDAVRGPWRIFHQAGQAQVDATQAAYDRLGVPARVVAFIDRMPELLAETDLVVSRAGGTTLAELAAAGIASVLVPYPHAADNHQLANACVFARAGGCRVVDTAAEDTALEEQLAIVLNELFVDPSARQRMATALAPLARPAAAKCVAKLLETVLRQTGRSPVTSS